MNKFRNVLSISWIDTIYFNFHYLPFKQAIKLPIFLYKSKILESKGTVIINCKYIKTGMIKLGVYTVSIYPNSGLIYKNEGGKLIFNGKCSVGSASSFSIGRQGILDIGDNFIATSALKLIAFYNIKIFENVLIGWNVLIVDTSFHKLKNINGDFRNKGYEAITISKNNWITTNCIILQGTQTPEYTVFGVGSLLNKCYLDFPTHVLLAGSPLEIKLNNVWIDPSDRDIFEYN